MPTARPDLPLAFVQQRFWYLDRMGAGAALNVSMVLRLGGELDAGALERALAQVARRHETVRTGFVVVEGALVQRVVDDVTIPVEAHTSIGAQGEEAWVRACAGRPFDLTRPPLLRADLARLDDGAQLLLLSMHHIVSDGLSMTNLLVELDRLLIAEARGGAADLPELPMQFGEHAVAERRAAEEADLEPALAWWREQLQGLSTLSLPTDRARPAEQGWHHDVCTRALPPRLSTELAALARARGVTLTTLLLAAWQLLLGRLSGQTDVAVGMPVTTRTRVPLEPIIGPMMDVLVLRADLSGDPSFAGGFLPAVAATLGGALAHGEVPFARLVEALDPVRDRSRHPLFQAMFTLATRSAGARPFGGVSAEFLEFQVTDTGVDLDLRVVDEGERLVARLVYDGELFEAATMETLTARFQLLLEGLVAEPSASIGDLPLMDGVERRLVLETWNATDAAPPAAACVQDWFASQAAARPGALAVTDGTRRLTYGALHERALRLARALRARGLGPGDRVALAVGRSVELPVALLGVLGCGAACVPLDLRHPVRRLRALVADAEPAAIVADAEAATAVAELGAPVVVLGADDESTGPAGAGFLSSPPADVAYVIYTSGSTGRPKGVVVPHGALVNLLAAMLHEPGLGADDVLLAVTTVSFDIALLELLGPLVAGGRVVLADAETTGDGHRLAALLADSGATVMQATPSTWRLLLAAEWPGDPALALWSGGEPLPRELADELLARGGRLFNLYGPTETCIWSLVDRVGPGSGPVPLGLPIANTRAYVLDPQLRPVPSGAVGELCLSGAGLAQGYWRREQRTAAAFVEHPFRPGERLYRTGDRACRGRDGRLVFLQRSDRQVKVRGHRIELLEVEHVLHRHPDVQAAAVLVRAPDTPQAELAAHVVWRPGARPDERALRSWLGEHLPRAMVPAWIATHAALPRNLSGKLDLVALAALARPDPRRAAGPPRPRNEHELLLAEAFAEALDLDDIGVDDNFFDLGGHSLLAVQVLHRVEQRTGIRLQPGELLVQDLAQLAETLATREPAAPAGLLSRLGGLLGGRGVGSGKRA